MSARIHCSYDTDAPTVWRLERDYARPTRVGVVRATVGFLWDGASVPRQFWDLIPPWGAYSGAALIHDWLYATKPDGVRRADADAVFRDLMRADHVPAQQAEIMYHAVRKFGGSAWNARTSGGQAA